MSLLSEFAPVEVRMLPVVLLLDTSGSMREDDKIDVLNDSVAEMIQELQDIDAGHGYITLSVVTFGGDGAEFASRNVPIADVAHAPLRASGRTPMGAAFRLARELLEDHNQLPSRAFRPTVALVSDGIPTDSPAWESELERLLTSDRGQKASRFALAIGADADRALLARFTGGEVHEASEAAQIRNFMQFVTMTITQTTQSLFDTDVALEESAGDSVKRLQADDAF